MDIYTTKQALEYLGISRQALFKYLKNPDMPIYGYDLNARAKVFTKGELDFFKQFMESEAFREMTRPGRRPDDPRTKTVIEDGEKKRVDMRYKNRRARYGRTSRTRSRRETD